MEKIIDYIIVHAINTDGLPIVVNRFLKKEYEIYGYPFIRGGEIHQVMVKRGLF